MTFDLKGRVALVTGGGQGVGAAVARLLAEHGAGVVVNDLRASRADAVVANIVDAGGAAVSAVADVTDHAAVERAVQSAARTLGDVDILVNNAGLPADGLRQVPFLKTDPADWDLFIDLNLRAVLQCTRAVLPSMVARGWGRIVTVVSDAGRVGAAGFTIYGAAKAGAAGFSRSLALEVGPHGVTSNCVSLGTIEGASSPTDPDVLARQVRRYARRRLGRADEVAAAILWLASDEADWVTGQTIPINGGFATT